MKQFNLEIDVKRRVSGLLGNAVKWIEPNTGSTFGVPDGYVLLGRRVVWVELKIGEFKQTNSGLVLKYEIRPDQVSEIKDLLMAGQSAVLIVGLKGTSDLLVFPADEEALMGSKAVKTESFHSNGVPAYLSGIDGSRELKNVLEEMHRWMARHDAL